MIVGPSREGSLAGPKQKQVRLHKKQRKGKKKKEEQEKRKQTQYITYPHRPESIDPGIDWPLARPGVVVDVYGQDLFGCRQPLGCQLPLEPAAQARGASLGDEGAVQGRHPLQILLEHEYVVEVRLGLLEIIMAR